MKEYNKPIKIAFFNQKGGTAKTTSTIDVAGILAKNYGKKVLVVDADPQANSSKTLLMESGYDENTLTIVDVIEGRCNINDAIQKALLKVQNGDRSRALPRGIDILPTKRGMSGLEIDDDFVIKNLVKQIRRTRNHCYNYNFILFDCPPYLSEFSINILATVDYVLVPASTDKDSLDGYGELIDTIQNLKIMNINSKIKVLGAFLTMFSRKNAIDMQIYNDCVEILGDSFIDIPIRMDTQAKEASYMGKPLCWYARTTGANRDYELLVREMFARIGLFENEEKKIYEKEKNSYLEALGLR